MAKYSKRVFFPKLLAIAAAVVLMVGASWAMNIADQDIQNPDRGVKSLDTGCGDCSIDYFGLRFTGSGGQGGRGIVYWPGGQTGNNYGQMCFTSNCDDVGNPLYAWCTDVYHPAETHNYGVDVNPLVISDDSCSKAQLTALAYLLAWYTPTTTFEDDAYQLAVWKLSSIRDGGLNDGLPHFCYDAGRGYPNLGDTPVYPYVNTVYGSNAPRNDWANTKVFEALGNNVILPGDAINDTCWVINNTGDSVTVLIKLCLERGSFAQMVGDTCSENVCLDVWYSIGMNDPVFGKYYTDANGCVWLAITQEIETRLPVTVRICSNWAWPVGLVGCEDSTYTDNQLLMLSGEGRPICFDFWFEGDKWLSVELAGFDAYTTVDGVDLQWSTASEANADHWEIERCVTGSGEFELIAQLPAHNSSTGATYQFADRRGVNGTMYDYRLTDIDASGERTVHPQMASALYGSHSAAVAEFSLADAYPNPFNPTTTISFTVPEAGVIELRIFDLAGREVATLVNGSVEAGSHHVEWNAASMPSGTYFYSLKAAGYTATKKLLLLK